MWKKKKKVMITTRKKKVVQKRKYDYGIYVAWITMCM